MRMLNLFVLGVMIASTAQGNITQLTCAECRDPRANWEDYGNFAYNQVFGANATLTPSEGSKMTVINPQDRWAVVDLDFVLGDTGMTALLGFLSLEIPSIPDTVQITVYTDTGQVFSTRAIPNGLSLIVGDPPSKTSSGSSGGSRGSRSSSGGGSGGYTTVPSSFRYRFSDGTSGTVSICNPDVRGDCHGP